MVSACAVLCVVLVNLIDAARVSRRLLQSLASKEKAVFEGENLRGYNSGNSEGVPITLQRSYSAPMLRTSSLFDVPPIRLTNLKSYERPDLLWDLKKDTNSFVLDDSTAALPLRDERTSETALAKQAEATTKVSDVNDDPGTVLQNDFELGSEHKPEVDVELKITHIEGKENNEQAFEGDEDKDVFRLRRKDVTPSQIDKEEQEPYQQQNREEKNTFELDESELEMNDNHNDKNSPELELLYKLITLAPEMKFLATPLRRAFEAYEHLKFTAPVSANRLAALAAEKDDLLKSLTYSLETLGSVKHDSLNAALSEAIPDSSDGKASR